jgi:3-deoxy-alpha-D-manno-octulosonate 8-oxidase
MKTNESNVRYVKNVLKYVIGQGALTNLSSILNNLRHEDGVVIYLIDNYFSDRQDIIRLLDVQQLDKCIFVQTDDEPTTDVVNDLFSYFKNNDIYNPLAIVGMGGGSTMDIAKALSNLFTNGGKAEDYQGWDLVKKPGIYKIAIPTISGTGAEATRTCVMTNKKIGLKLGMNSDFTVFDQIIMDPSLTATVPRNQYFYTGMDAYIHCIESLSGSYRNAIGDAYSRETINLCQKIFLGEDMMTPSNRERLMVASYLGGCAIATSYVGLVHPLSAGLSVVLGLHHCVANCIVMRAMQPYYPEAYDEFWTMVDKQGVEIPEGVARNLSEAAYEELYAATVIHEKPLTNALGVGYRDVLTKAVVKNIFQAM